MGMNTAAVQRLYVAYFNRPADPVSLAVYESMLPEDREATQAELQALADTYFSPSAEYQDLYAGKSNAQIVDQLYQNIFGRPAEVDGLVHWAAKLTSGEETVASLALQLSYSAQGTDADVVANRIEAATAFTEALDTTDEITGFSGNAAAASARDWLATVGSDDASKDAAIAGVDTAVSGAVAAASPAAAGEQKNLGTGLDDVTMGAGDDQIFATDSTTAASDTFNVSDSVDGGDGDDTFYLTVDSIAGATTYTPSRLTNIETLSVTNVDATPDTVTINASLMAPTAVEVSASTAGVNITNVNAGTAITLTGNTGAVDIQHKNAGLTGSSDSVTINMTGNTGTVTVDSDGAQDIESATINATGVNSGTLVIGDSGGSTITSLDVNGTGSLTITGGDLATLTSLDASDNSGGVSYTTQVTATTVTLTGGSGNDTLTGNTGADVITGGAGDDTLSTGAAGGNDHIDGGAGNDTVTVAGVNKDDTISGGDGTDTLKINGALAYSAALGTNDAAGISGFETLYVDTTLSQDMTPLTGITSLIAGAGDVATLTKVDGITSVTMASGASAGADLTLATNGTADALTVNLGSDLAQAASTSTTLDAVQYESLTVNSAGADGNSITVTATSLADLTLAGSKNLTVTVNPDTGATTLAALKTIDASGTTGTVSVTAGSADAGVTVTPGSGALTVTLGDGADTVTGTAAADNITTALGNDTITGNGGNDTVNAGGGDDTVTLGDGNNNVTLGAGADTLTAGNGNNTVTNASGNSTVTLGNGTNTVTNTAGNMTVTTGTGADTITNTAGNATIVSGAGNDTITNTSGNSTITASAGNNTVTNTAGNSTITTGAGNDTITLTAGNSNVTAGAGNDTITLGSGTDTVDGGAGTDTATFSHGAGIYDASISNVETVTGTMTGSGTIDLDAITGVTTLSITANATAASLTVRDVASGTVLNLSDDLAEDASNGDLQTVTIDTVAEASMTLKVLGNQEAALVAATTLDGGVTITDADSVTITGDGGPNVDQPITNDLVSLALDDTDTTSLTVNTVAYGGIDIGALTGVSNLDSLTITTAAEGDFAMTTAAEVDALTTLSVTAAGEGDVSMGAIGGTARATLDTIAISASSGADVTTAAISSSIDMSSLTVTANGSGSSVTLGGTISVGASGNDITTVNLTASDGGAITASAAAAMEWDAVTSMTLAATGTGSSFTLETAALESDVENLTLTVTGASASMDIGAGQFLDDIDTLAITVGSYSTLTADGDVDFTDEAGMESFSFNISDNATVDTEGGGSEAQDGIVVTSASWAAMEISIGASVTVEDDMLNLISTGEEGLVTDLDLDISGGGSAVIVDLEGADLVTLGGTPIITQDDDAEGVLNWDEGSITITGSASHTVDLGESAEAFTVTTGSGADTITSGDGNDVINSGAGADIINIEASGNNTVTTGTGADDVVWASEGTTFGITTVTDFVSGVDDLDLSGIGTDVDDGDGEVITAARAQAALVDNAITIVNINAATTSLDSAGTELVADFEDMTDVSAYISEGFTVAASDEAVIILTNGTNSYIYYWIDTDAGGDVDSGEVQLIGIVSGEASLAAGDVI
jgi:Ca2+-binding RTX toxin-like protein